jgi:hypothetical protein
VVEKLTHTWPQGFLVTLAMAQWAKKRQEEDISQLKGIEARYEDMFDVMDEWIIKAFNDSSKILEHDVLKLAMHTLISGAKANLFS